MMGSTLLHGWGKVSDSILSGVWHMRPPATLLLVDDETETCRQLAELLNAELGVQVELAASIAEAKEKLESKPALLISDLSLPDGDGMALLSAIQESHLPTRVIVMTGV